MNKGKERNNNREINEKEYHLKEQIHSWGELARTQQNNNNHTHTTPNTEGWRAGWDEWVSQKIKERERQKDEQE